MSSTARTKINQIYLQRTDNRDELDALYYEVIHNLVLEATRLGIEVKNLKMRAGVAGQPARFRRASGPGT